MLSRFLRNCRSDSLFTAKSPKTPLALVGAKAPHVSHMTHCLGHITCLLVYYLPLQTCMLLLFPSLSQYPFHVLLQVSPDLNLSLTLENPNRRSKILWTCPCWENRLAEMVPSTKHDKVSLTLKRETHNDVKQAHVSNMISNKHVFSRAARQPATARDRHSNITSRACRTGSYTAGLKE